ncbi:hypothetical protein VNO77_42076 [Canavalia gladiata]|uniref:Uncharacterized protein n=1 Tax=Canavalia gladiata TaxID=3824 RepID=A0AAN9JZK8_CANGL
MWKTILSRFYFLDFLVLRPEFSYSLKFCSDWSLIGLSWRNQESIIGWPKQGISMSAFAIEWDSSLKPGHRRISSAIETLWYRIVQADSRWLNKSASNDSNIHLQIHCSGTLKPLTPWVNQVDWSLGNSDVVQATPSARFRLENSSPPTQDQQTETSPLSHKLRDLGFALLSFSSVQVSMLADFSYGVGFDQVLVASRLHDNPTMVWMNHHALAVKFW